MRTAIAIVIATVISGSAMAADVPVKAPAYARPTAPPPYNWSGLYLGANIGGAFSSATANVAGTIWDPGATEFIGGFQVGYNWQFGHFLVGVEGDFDWAAFGRPNIPLGTPLGPVQASADSKLDQHARRTLWNYVRQMAVLRQGRRRLGRRPGIVELAQRNELDGFKYYRWLGGRRRNRIRIQAQLDGQT